MKNVLPVSVLNSAASLGATFTSATVDAEYLDNLSIALICTATAGAANGTFGVDVSHDQTNWIALTLPGSPALTGTNKNVGIELNQLVWPYFRVVYTRTSGTGSMKLSVFGKAI